MPFWVKVILGVICLAVAFAEFVGPSWASKQSWAAAYSWSRMLRSVVLALIFFLVEWPKLITYALAVLTLKALFQLFLTLGSNIYGDDSLRLKQRTAAVYLTPQQRIGAVLLFLYGCSLAASVYLVGY